MCTCYSGNNAKYDPCIIIKSQAINNFVKAVWIGFQFVSITCKAVTIWLALGEDFIIQIEKKWEKNF